MICWNCRHILDRTELNSWSYLWLQFLSGPTSVDLIKKKKKSWFAKLSGNWAFLASELLTRASGSWSVHVGVCVPEIVRACSWTLWELCFWVYVSGFGFADSWVYVWFLIIRRMLARVVVNQKCIFYPLSSFFFSSFFPFSHRKWFPLAVLAISREDCCSLFCFSTLRSSWIDEIFAIHPAKKKPQNNSLLIYLQLDVI